MEQPLTQKRQILLSPEEVKALDQLARAVGCSSGKLLRELFLTGFQASAEALVAGLTMEQARERALKAMRLLSQLYEKEAQRVKVLEERQRIGKALRELRERIYREVGNIPDVEGLIDAGRDAE